MTTYFKVLHELGPHHLGGLYSGERWFLPNGNQPGKWMPFIRDIRMCKRGYHLTTLRGIAFWSGRRRGSHVYLAEGRGLHNEDSDLKTCFQEARLIREVPTPQIADVQKIIVNAIRPLRGAVSAHLSGPSGKAHLDELMASTSPGQIKFAAGQVRLHLFPRHSVRARRAGPLLEALAHDNPWRAIEAATYLPMAFSLSKAVADSHQKMEDDLVRLLTA